MPIAEVTVQAILPAGRKSPSGKTIPFDAIVTAEQGTISLQHGQKTNFKINHVFEVGYTEKGEYKNDGTFLKDLTNVVQRPKQNTRASTSNSDALHIFVNGKLTAFIAAGEIKLALTEIVEAIDLLVDAYNRSKLSGNKAQTRDDLQDEIGF